MELSKEEKYPELLLYGVQALDSDSVSLPIKNKIINPMKDASQYCAAPANDPTSSLSKNCRNLKRKLEQTNADVNLRVSFLLIFYELCSSQELLLEAQTILQNIHPDSPLTISEKRNLEQLKMQVSKDLILHPSKHARSLLKQGQERPLRDHVLAVWNELPPGLGIQRDSYIECFANTLNNTKAAITKEDIRFITDIAKHDTKEHIYHQSIGLYIAFQMSRILGKTVAHRLFHSIDLFQTILENENLSTDTDANNTDTTPESFFGVVSSMEYILEIKNKWLRVIGNTRDSYLNAIEPQFEGMWRIGFTCDGCGVVRERCDSFRKCGRCRRRYYCSVECQARHWGAGHRLSCRREGEFEVGDIGVVYGLRIEDGPQTMNGEVVRIEGVKEMECTVSLMLVDGSDSAKYTFQMRNLWRLYSAEEWEETNGSMM
ncbi:hypothetical protein HDU79_003190 [Rhizoclosmatium sp. JEL0117]|nr:hypothetical protein HDU79_003190 [Rhizoclosmatium sp. JEL0117]